jgi:hypothetical protein
MFPGAQMFTTDADGGNGVSTRTAALAEYDRTAQKLKMKNFISL